MNVLPASGGATAKPAAKPAAKTSGPTAAGNSLLTVGAELLGVGLLALVAGINDQAGKLIVMIMVGFWLIYLVGPGVPQVAKLGSDFQAITNNQ